jgi:uncharacterized damage-inducible protein DinB
MPGMPPPIQTEAEGLVVYLRQQRAGLLNAAFGLSEDQLRSRPSASALSVGGLLKHAAQTERQWVDMIARQHTSFGHGPEQGSEQSYVDSFALAQGDTLASLSSELTETAATTERVVAVLPDLGVEVQLAEGPWYPRGGGYTARWILLHVLEELSRHAGHADIVREHLDGATMYALMAAVEGWPEDRWIKPWRPSSG